MSTDHHLTSHRSLDLGVSTWHEGQLGGPEVVSAMQLSGQLILATLTVKNHGIWVAISHDHVSFTLCTNNVLTWLGIFKVNSEPDDMEVIPEE